MAWLDISNGCWEISTLRLASECDVDGLHEIWEDRDRKAGAFAILVRFPVSAATASRNSNLYFHLQKLYDITCGHINDSMAEEEKPRNRKERRAAAKENGKAMEPPTVTPKIKLVKPDFDARPPKGTTLLDIYEEKKALLDQGQPFDDKHSDGLARGESGNILDVGLGDNEPIGPIGNAIFWSVCLTMLHFTLDVLTYNQYAQDIIWPAIFKRSGTILPILFLAIYMMQSELAHRLGLVRQVLFLCVAVAAGCYLIYAGNTYGYFAVMKQAPPLGTLWVYSVIELDLWFAVASLVFNFAFLLFNGYTVF